MDPIEDNGGLVRGHYAFIPKKKIPASGTANGVDLRANHAGGVPSGDMAHCVSARSIENPTSQRAAVKKDWENDEWMEEWLRLARLSEQRGTQGTESGDRRT